MDACDQGMVMAWFVPNVRMVYIIKSKMFC